MLGILLSVCFAAETLMPVYEDCPNVDCETVIERVRTEVPVYREKLETIRRQTMSTFAAAPSAYQAERIDKRLLMAVRCCDFVEGSAEKGDATGCGFAERGLDDLASFVESFEAEFECWKYNPDNPQVKPVELDVRDFGAKGDGETDFVGPFVGAMSAVRALGGKPSVLRIPAGDYITLQCPDIAQLVVYGVTNCLIRGEGPDRTHIRFGVFAKPGLRVQDGCNVTIRGVELGLKRLPYFQGEILANEKERDCVVVRQTPGTLDPNDPCWTNRVRQQYCSSEYDPKTGRICNDTTWTSYACESERLGNGVWRLKFDPNLIYCSHRLMRPGNIMVLPFRYNVMGVCYCVGGRLVTFDDVTIRSSHSAAFGGSGIELLSLVRCKVLPMPGMYISSDADGCIASRSTYLAHCDFRNMGDDGLNLVTHGVRVRKAGTASDAHDRWNVKGPKGRYVVIDQTTGVYRGNFRDDEPLPDDSVGKDQIYMPTIDGTGGVVTDCKFVMNRGASIVIQTPNALVEDTIADGASGGVRVGSLMRACEGPGPYNCLFRNVRATGGKRGFYAELETQNRKPALTAGLRGITWERCVSDGAEEPLRLYNVGASTMRDCSFDHAGNKASMQLSFCDTVSLVGCKMDGQPMTQGDLKLDCSRSISVSAPMDKAPSPVAASPMQVNRHPRSLKVLAIGNSFSHSLMAQLPICAKALPDAELDFATIAIGGCSLERHWDNIAKSGNPEFRPYDVHWSFASAPDKKMSPFGEAMKNGKANIPLMLQAYEWDIVTIQQVSTLSWDEKTYQPYADNLIAKIRELAPQAEIRIQQTWAYCNADARICADATPGKPGTWGINQRGMHDGLTAAYDKLAERYHLKIIPSGDAVSLYRKALPVTFNPPTKKQLAAFKDGELPDMGGDPVGIYHWGKGPSWNKVAKDYKLRCDSIHLNKEGEYLQACTWLASLFDDDLSRLSYKPDFLSEEKAALMRKCAVEAVKAR